MFVNYFLVFSACLVMTGFGMPQTRTVSTSKGVESTTIKVLMPPSSSFDEDEDDAVIIDADDTSPPKDLTPDNFKVTDCYLPKVKGPCKAIIESWTYNVETSSCETFSWSGCGGNNNRFSEKEFCDNHCTNVLSKTKTGSSSSKCPAFDGCGPLKCGVSKDPVTGCEKCECNLGNDAIILGSVSGNPEDANQQAHIVPVTVGTSLLVKTEDNKKPVGKPEEVCYLPETRGNCRAMMTRWRYSPELKECVQFHFGGCDANSNNFVSNEKCLEFCRGQ